MRCCSGSTTLAGMALDFQAVYLSVASVLTCIAFFCLLLAENGRIPVDNPDTHLELTMIHECMLLEYSGRLLAVIHWASMLKTLVFLVLFSLLYLPAFTAAGSESALGSDSGKCYGNSEE